jgi:NitT/TauT family transport system ATP-binding protein
VTQTQQEERPWTETGAGGGDLAVEIQGVTKHFGRGKAGMTALNDVDLTVRRGEFVTIVGASGCGKSTLLNLVAGLDTADSGTVLVNGTPVTGSSQTTKSRVAFMFQEATLLPWLTVQQNVELAMKLQGLGKEERRAKVEDLLKLVRLNGKADKRPHELSGGMRQRVSLARVLAQDANVVLMDEPLGALDAMTRDTMHDEIERIWSQLGLTILFVTHNVREAVRLGDRIVLMSSTPGRVKRIYEVSLERPRRMDDADVANRAGLLTDDLREEVRRHVA